MSGVTVVETVMPSVTELLILEVTLDGNLTFRRHVSNVCWSADFHLLAQRHIRGMFKLTEEDTAWPLHSSIHASTIHQPVMLVLGLGLGP